jgi:hypothetical protein
MEKFTKFATFARVYIYRILQHFATKLRNFANFKTLFLAVVMAFVILHWSKLQPKSGIVCLLANEAISYISESTIGHPPKLGCPS